MDIHQLKIYNHLAGTLHFGKTSRACHITPSALTRMIQRLEQEVGLPLFNRDNRTVELTPAGDAFRRYADDVIQRWGDLQNDLIQDDHLRGAISLYGSVTAVYSILPNILTAYRTRYPDVQIHLETGDAAMALLRLQNHEVDVAIAAIPEKIPKGVEMMQVTQTPLVFIAPRHFPGTIRYLKNNGDAPIVTTPPEKKVSHQKGFFHITDKREIDWQTTPLIIANQGLSRDRFDKWLSHEKISPTIYAQVAGNEAMLAMVSLGCGVGVIPQLVLENSPLKDEICIVRNAPRLTPFSIGIGTLKKNMKNPRIQAFWDISGER